MGTEGPIEAIKQLLRHFVTVTCVSVHQQSDCSFDCYPCVNSIGTLVYIVCPFVLSCCSSLSCYVIVYLGNGF